MTIFSQFCTRILWTTILTVIAFFWFTVFRLSFNFPYYDDFENIVQFIYKFEHSQNPVDAVGLLFDQNFEHRLLFSKVVATLQYLLTRQLNMRWLIIWGDLSLLGIAVIFYQFHRKEQLSLPALVAICCLLFQVQHYADTVLWATCSLQHAPCIAFSLWSFYTAITIKKYHLSALLAAIALFTSANGFAAVVIWLMIVWATSNHWKQVLTPSILLIAATAIHLATLSLGPGSMLTKATSNIWPKLFLLLSFAGQVADTDLINKNYSIWLGIAILLPVLIVFVQLMRQKHRRITDLQWLCVAGICSLLFVAFLICFARGIEPDDIGYKMDRYKIYAALFAVLATAFYDRYWDNFVCYPPVFHDIVLNDYFSEAQETYLIGSLPSTDSPILQIDWQRTVDSLTVECKDNTQSLELRNGIFKESEGYDHLYVVALNDTDLQPRYLMKVANGYDPALRRFSTTLTRPASNGFSCEIFKTKMKPGVYDLRLISIKKGHAARVYKLLKIKV
ncbi:hypothetical protein LZD49_01615 [Dyadobacter sp. CY261]|uniref:hypothetical protein n=1 Tax=Dyadobacter sp. CY261 TaxID=2907203 RepID=UPI001F48B5FD|nr:hypothetical protein [Dyadobacter sp. CY261]MCF0069149.1 hypothetical protein [Dyadobacter sp. CY261]